MASVPSDKLNLAFNSNLGTDQIVFTKDVVEEWPASPVNSTFRYDTGLNDFCLPTAQFSIDGTNWYDQHSQEKVTLANFGTPFVNDQGVIRIPQGSPPASVTKLYIRLACFAHPGQKPFNRVSDGRTVSYTSALRYKQIAISGMIEAEISGGNEVGKNYVLPHGLGYVPSYRVFRRSPLTSGTTETSLMFSVTKPMIKVDKDNLYLDTTYNSTPSGDNFSTGAQYFYFVYHD